MSDATPQRSSGSENQNPNPGSSNSISEDQAAIKFHHDRLAAVKAGKMKSVPFNGKKPEPAPIPPRIRTEGDVDFSKAIPGCKRCYGTGILHYQVVVGSDEKIPVVCKCLTRNGGLKKDQLDRILEGKPPTAEEIARLRNRS